MNRTNKNAGVQPGADTTEHFRLDYTRSNRGAAQASPTCGKQAAFALFNCEVLPLAAVDRMFRRNPEWVSA